MFSGWKRRLESRASMEAANRRRAIIPDRCANCETSMIFKGQLGRHFKLIHEFECTSCGLVVLSKSSEKDVPIFAHLSEAAE
jgi:hypothetical protein